MTFDLPKKLAEFLLKNPKRIHLIGVAGSGMSGIAGLLLALGHRVSGCDRVSTLETRRLETLGLEILSSPNRGDGSRRRTDSLFFGDQNRKSRV